MKTTNTKSIKTISLVTLFLGAIYMLFIYQKTISLLWLGDDAHRIIWNEDRMGWQIAVFLGYTLGWTAVYALCALIEINILKGLRTGNLFPKKNVRLIMLAALCTGIALFFGANVEDVVKGVVVSVIDSNCIFFPLIIIVIGLFYKQASLACEDSNLAI